MRERLVLLTGHMAMPRLETTMASMGETGFDWTVVDGGTKVAALMTEEIIRRRVVLPTGTTRLLLPGRCRADPARLSQHFGIAVERGPDEIVDLPSYFGRGARKPDLSGHDVRIFAEIVNAPHLAPDAILSLAQEYVAKGADVIDLGCLPDTPFPHLEESVKALHAHGHKVSVDSFSLEELERGASAGADYLLSLNETTLHLAFETDATPVLVSSQPSDLDALVRAAERLAKAGKPFLADPVLEPIHFGFAQSLARYATFRSRMPEVEMMMGTGNLTELTEADSLGVTAMLLGVCSELSIRNVLVVQVSPHTRRTIEEHDAARRLMYAAKADRALPKGYGNALLALHDKRPFTETIAEIEAAAAQVRDANFRITVASDGIHVYNRDSHVVGTEALALFSKLAIGSDTGHAFYLGGELAKAEIAWRLGKRYSQDEPLDFGCAADAAAGPATGFKPAGPTFGPSGRTES